MTTNHPPLAAPPRPAHEAAELVRTSGPPRRLPPPPPRPAHEAAELVRTWASQAPTVCAPNVGKLRALSLMLAFEAAELPGLPPLPQLPPWARRSLGAPSTPVAPPRVAAQHTVAL